MAARATLPVLFLDAGQRSALAAIRSIGSRGLALLTASPHTSSIGGISRYVSAQYVSPDPSLDFQALAIWLDNLQSEIGSFVLFPVTDAASLLADSARTRIAGPVVMPPSTAYSRASDKLELVQLAQQLGVPVPATIICASRAQLAETIRNRPLPFVVKPARSRIVVNGRVFPLSVHVVQNLHDVDLISQAAWIDYIPALVQEFIPGHGAGIFTIYGPGGPLAWFAHRRLREKPPSGGVSVLSESVPVDPRLLDLSQLLLDQMAWQGLAMVEFRIADDGTPYLMEINARLWGSVQLAIDCGIDFPWLAYQVAIGESPAPVTGYAVGRRLRWLLGDADNLWLQWKDRRTSVGRKLAASGRFLSSFADLRARNEVLRWDDPVPAWLEVQQWFRRST